MTQLGLTSGSSSVNNDIQPSFSSLIDSIANKVEKGLSNQVSLAHVAKQYIIESPCFIQNVIAEDPIVSDIIKNLYNIYLAFIALSLGGEQILLNGQRVRDIISTVSTNDQSRHPLVSLKHGVSNLFSSENFVDLEDISGSFNISNESTSANENEGKNETVTRVTEYENQYDEHGNPIYTYSHTDKHGVHQYTNQRVKSDKVTRTETTSKNTGSSVTEDPESRYNSGQNHYGTVIKSNVGERIDQQITIPIASGRIFNVTLATGVDSPPITVPLLVRFNNRIISNSVPNFLFSLNFSPSLWHRWLMFRAGEIKFWKDFVFSRDRAKAKASALKKDEHGVVGSMLHHQTMAKHKYMSQILTGSKHPSQNLANSVLIVEDQQARTVLKNAGIDFDNTIHRQRFFNDMYSLFIVFVDQRSNRVTIYTNGLSDSTSHSYNELRTASSSDKISVMDALNMLSQQRNPTRF